jgi:hypothetical protein
MSPATCDVLVADRHRRQADEDLVRHRVGDHRGRQRVADLPLLRLAGGMQPLFFLPGRAGSLAVVPAEA